MVILGFVIHVLFVLQLVHAAAFLQVLHDTSHVVQVGQPVHVLHLLKQFCVARTWGPLRASVGYKGRPFALTYWIPGTGLTDNFWS